MILLPHFLVNEFRDSFKQQINISYRGMKSYTSPCGKLVTAKYNCSLDFIWFPFKPLAFIEVYVLAIATCASCFTGKISRVHTSVVK